MRGSKLTAIERMNEEIENEKPRGKIPLLIPLLLILAVIIAKLIIG